MPRLVILTEIISPYRIPLFNALAQDGGVDLHVIFLAETDPILRQWHIYKEEIRFSYQVLPSWRGRLGKQNLLLNRRVRGSLRDASPDVILCGGYNYAAYWQALFWAGSCGIPFLLWSESHLHETRAGFALVELLKSQFLKRCDGFVVPGRSAREYLRTNGVREQRIFIAPNAIDNQFFAAGAARSRIDREVTRSQLDLPTRYFLFVGRLVREKGVFELIDAYAKLDDSVRREFALVLVGDGPQREQLVQQALAISPGIVKFAGFRQREDLPKYYALAEVLILATYTDAWGLVVNEGMACGLPVIVSRNAGCASDLVREGWNGVLIPPRDICSLASAMRNFAENPGLGVTMSANTLQLISKYSAQEWSKGVDRAVRSVLGQYD